MTQRLLSMAGAGFMAAIATAHLPRQSEKRLLEADVDEAVRQMETGRLAGSELRDLKFLNRPRSRKHRTIRPRRNFSVQRTGMQTWVIFAGHSGRPFGVISQAAPNRFQWRLSKVRRYHDRSPHNTGHASSLNKAVTAVLLAQRGQW